MKLVIILALILSPIVGYSQNGFPEGTYTSELGDIVIRNDSVIAEGVSYYAFYYRNSENMINGLTTISYTSKNKRQELKIVFKSGTPRYLSFNYKNYSEEAFNIAFIPG